MLNNSYILSIVKYILDVHGVTVGIKDIYKILVSDRNFPSLLSIVNTLSFWGITAKAFQSDIEHISKIKNTILVHSVENDGHFYVLKRIDANGVILYDEVDRRIPLDNFCNIWDGIALVVEDTGKYKSSLPIRKLSIFVLLLLLLLCMSKNIDIINRINIALDFVAIVVTFKLYQKYRFDYVKIPFCVMGRIFDCSITSSKNPFGKLPVSLPMLGLFYFVWDVFYNLFFGNSDLYVALFYVIAVLVMGYLVGYQLIKIRKFCTYCMLVSFVCFLKLFINSYVNSFTVNSLCGVAFSVVCSVVICRLIYYSVKYSKIALNFETDLLRFKRNPNVLKILLSNSESFAIQRDKCLRFGNESANIQIDMVIDIECRHCKDNVIKMCKLIERYPSRYCWNLFLSQYDVGKVADELFVKLNKKQLSFIDCYEQNKLKVFEKIKMWDWNVGSGNTSYHIVDRYKSMLKQISEKNISSYPIIAINGKILPKEYDISDLQFFE